MIRFWSSEKYVKSALVSVYYTKIAAKSNRICSLISCKGKGTNSTIVGAKFNEQSKKHIITHCFSLDDLNESVINIDKVIDIVKTEFSGLVCAVDFNSPQKIDSIKFSNFNIPKTTFQRIIVDSSFVEKIDVEKANFKVYESSIISFYKTEGKIYDILTRLGVKIYKEKIIDDTTGLFDKDQVEILLQKVPYLVAMATEDFSKLSPSDLFHEPISEKITIPDYSVEPIIGVIDTLFDDRVYFSKWVEFHNMISEDIETTQKDYIHGTAVSSIIVDGPVLNPELDDGCGRFRVRHFGVSADKGFSSFTIIKLISEIIVLNRDIKVWNLSLGSNEEVNNNFISLEAAKLDQIQFDNDVIFVISGTNKKINAPKSRIGAPADSINSVIVNSVGFDGKPTDYSREGIVLSFFTKPDISYYGGDQKKYIKVCEPLGSSSVCGTSFAAPWISRKLSYLIDVLGFSREIAKALLIDSAIGWNSKSDFETRALIGHGVVPIKINDIIRSPDNEIRFVITGISEKFDTYSYNFPIPIHKDEFPYIAKATLCYFPKCSRNQGVDYTNTELDLYFGRIDNNSKLKSIDNNSQSIEDETHYLYEEDARRQFRKWDNVKHIQDEVKQSPRGRKVYTNKMWGMSIKTKERLETRDGEGIRFGVVVTLREIKGVNRIAEFIQQCSLRGWLVNRVNIENKLDIYQVANEEIELL